MTSETAGVRAEVARRQVMVSADRRREVCLPAVARAPRACRDPVLAVIRRAVSAGGVANRFRCRVWIDRAVLPSVAAVDRVSMRSRSAVRRAADSIAAPRVAVLRLPRELLDPWMVWFLVAITVEAVRRFRGIHEAVIQASGILPLPAIISRARLATMAVTLRNSIGRVTVGRNWVARRTTTAEATRSLEIRTAVATSSEAPTRTPTSMARSAL